MVHRLCIYSTLLVLVTSGCTTISPSTTSSPTPTERIARDHVSVAVDGAELMAHVVSPAEPQLSLLALHGGPGVASSYMQGLGVYARDGYNVVTYDQRGVGASKLPSMDYSMQAYISDLEAIQTATARSPTVLFGHSWGGLLAMNYAAVHPDRVGALVLFGSAPPTRSALSQAARRFERRVERLQREGIVPDPVPSDERYLRAIQPVYFFDPTFPLPPALQELDFSPDVNRRTWAALGDFDFRPRLNEIEQPVLFFYGEDDPFGEGMAEASLGALNESRLEVVWLEKCGHYWFECRQAFETPLLAFLKRVASNQQLSGATDEFD